MIKLLGTNVLIKKLPNNPKIGSLFIPENTKTLDISQAQVIAVGNGARHPKTRLRQALDLEPGDLVFLTKFSGTKITIDMEDYYVCKYGEILGKLEEE